MNMKRTILNFMQTRMLSVAVCTCMVGFSTVCAYAQSEDDEEEVGSVIKQPKRTKVAKEVYPMMTLKGKVTDLATGKPLVGIQLQSLGNNRYTAMTEEDGSFEIKVPTFTTALYVHAPEYLSQQVAVVSEDSTQVVSVKMLSDKFQQMYGTGTDYTAKRTASINRFGVTVDNEIANKLGGDMRSIMRSAAVDGGASMFIRGLNSITADAQPLVVVDGIEMDMQRDRYSLHDGQFNNVLANISPDDIEKVTVLKNATALYGARGANGVLLIETKRGHSMATRIEANVAVGVQLLPRMQKLMDATQYRNYASEMIGTIKFPTKQNNEYAFLNDDKTNPYYYMYHNDTDWSKYVYRKAMTQNYSVNVQGGDDVGMYNLSVGYVKAQNTVKESAFDRMNVRFNTDINILWNLSTKFDISIARTNNTLFDDGMQEDFNSSTVTSPTALALIKSPLLNPYQYNSVAGRFTNLLSDYDNLLGRQNSGTTYYMGAYAQSLANPVALIENGTADSKNKSENTFFNVRVAPEFIINNALKVKADLSYSLNRNAQRYYRPFRGVPFFAVDDLGAVTAMVSSMFAKEQNFVAKAQLDWTKRFGKHEINAYVGGRYNYFSFDNSDLTTEYRGIVDDKNPVLSTAGFPGIEGVNDVWKQIQWYGNADYNFQNRYFATISLLAESNSRFGKNASGLGVFGVKWAFFPSVQLGWVMTNENWLPKNSVLNYLRLNLGYDMSGNDHISNYAARTSYTAVKYYDAAMGVQLTNVGNDKIQWETTHKFNVGVQAYLFNNRLGVNFDYYYHKTNNLLMLKSFSNPIGGINRYWSNGGSLSNRGLEVTVSGKPLVQKDWTVEVGASLGHYKNKVAKLPDGDYTTSIYGDNNILTSVGNPVAMFYGYKTAGVFASDAEASAAGNNGYLYMEDNAGQRQDFKAGDVHFVDINGDGKINEADKTIIGNPNPDIYGNIFANVTWKSLTLSLGFNYSLGNDVYNYQRSILNAGSNFFNQQVSEVNRWRYEGQQATLPRANFGDPMNNNRFSDRWIEDGSYLRLKTVHLSYKLPIPGSWTWLQGVSVWAEAQNLFTLTKYLGNDPEFSINSGVYYQGIDCGNLAQGRSFIAGVKINL